MPAAADCAGQQVAQTNLALDPTRNLAADRGYHGVMAQRTARSLRRIALAALVLTPHLCGQDSPAGKSQPRESNAVTVYNMAIDEARRVFSIKAPEMLNLPYEATEQGYLSAFWIEKCNKSAVARSLFAQAARTPHCKFGILPSGRSQLAEMSPVLWQLRTLVFARGMQNAKNTPDTALLDAASLLHHARQLFAGPSTGAIALGYVAEANALTVIDTALGATSRDAEASQRLRKLLEEHRKLRVTRQDIADVTFEETMRRLKVIPGIINSKDSRLRIIDRLNKILLVVRDPTNASLDYTSRSPKQAASNWSRELFQIKRPVPADDELRKAYDQSLKLPAIAGLEGLLNRHAMGQKQLEDLLKRLPK